jgi:trk system potassium uptake protein
VKEIADEITEAVVLDATDEEALRQADITAFQTVVVAISGNFETNALITSTLKKLGIAQVISESNTDRHREILSRIGADRVILPKEESGTQLADELSIPGMLEILHLSQEYSLIEIKPPLNLVGKGVEACEPYQVIVVLIVRKDELIINPDQSTQFLPDDILVLVGEKRRLAEFSSQE